MFERDERVDVLLNEAAVLMTIWNLQIGHSLLNPDMPFERVMVQISQKNLLECVGRMGHAALERACDRLVEMGRLRRQRSNPREAYAYQVNQEGIARMYTDLMIWGTPMLRQDEHGRIVEIRLIESGNTKAAGFALDEFFGFHLVTDDRTEKSQSEESKS